MISFSSVLISSYIDLKQIVQMLKEGYVLCFSGMYENLARPQHFTESLLAYTKIKIANSLWKW